MPSERIHEIIEDQFADQPDVAERLIQEYDRTGELPVIRALETQSTNSPIEVFYRALSQETIDPEVVKTARSLAANAKVREMTPSELLAELRKHFLTAKNLKTLCIPKPGLMSKESLIKFLCSPG